MKNIKLFLISIIISSQLLHADMHDTSLAIMFFALGGIVVTPLLLANDGEDNSRCKQYQDSMTAAIKMLSKNNTEFVLATYPVLSPPKLVACRKDYEQRHPNTFAEDPSIIRVNEDGSIATNLLYKKEQIN